VWCGLEAGHGSDSIARSKSVDIITGVYEYSLAVYLWRYSHVSMSQIDALAVLVLQSTKFGDLNRTLWRSMSGD
jgi:hypothetical protein